MKNYSNVFIWIFILITFLSLTACNSQEQLVEIQDVKKRFKISVPKDWKITEDAEFSSWYIEHPMLKEKYSISIQWFDYKGFMSSEDLDAFVEQFEDLSQINSQFNTEMILSSRGCRKLNSLQVCEMYNKGVDIEGDHFVVANFYISNFIKEEAHLDFSVRVSKKEFDDHEKELIEQILESIVFL